MALRRLEASPSSSSRPSDSSGETLPGHFRSRQLYREALRSMPGGVSSPVRAFSPHPVYLTRGQGAYVWDADGHRYVDLCLAYGPLILGHAHPEVLDAVQERIRRGWIFGAPVEEEIRLARQVSRHHPSAEMVRFVSTGSEAVVSLLRLARAYTGRPSVVKMDGGYHGSVDALMVHPSRGTGVRPSSPGAAPPRGARTYVVPFNDADRLEGILEAHDDIGLVLLEPVLGNIGTILPEPGYLRRVRQVCSRYGVLLAFDEVITSYRLGIGGAERRFGVRPDLLVLGKVIGGGFPLAAYAGRRDILSLVSPQGPVYQAGTFSGHPASLTAGLATLRVLEREGLGGAEKQTHELARGLAEEARRRNIPLQVPHIGTLLSLFIASDPVRDAAAARRSDLGAVRALLRSCLQQGVYVPQSPQETLFLSLVHTDADITRVRECVATALGQQGKQRS